MTPVRETVSSGSDLPGLIIADVVAGARGNLTLIDSDDLCTKYPKCFASNNLVNKRTSSTELPE